MISLRPWSSATHGQDYNAKRAFYLFFSAVSYPEWAFRHWPSSPGLHESMQLRGKKVIVSNGKTFFEVRCGTPSHVFKFRYIQ